jgi:prepilin-type N-terminal cleavage/methylation domain-containing protein
MRQRSAFTLLEVLISIALLGIVIVALFSTVDMMQNSNKQLAEHLKKAKAMTAATKVLYLDIVSSDGNISIEKDERSRVCIEETRHSVYALPSAKVCWVVLKESNQLVRIEGNGYQLPLDQEDKVEVDVVMNEVELFDVYHEKDKVLVLIKEPKKEPISFMVQGISQPVEKKKDAGKTNVRIRDANTSVGQ